MNKKSELNLLSAKKTDNKRDERKVQLCLKLSIELLLVWISKSRYKFLTHLSQIE